MTYNMTKGPVLAPLFRFTVPLILGNLFQLTYNAADSIIVGRFVGEEALAAVGAAGPVMNIVTFLVVGACLGAGVLMSEFFGAGDEETLRSEVGTSLTAGFLFTMVMAVLCAAAARHMLSITNVPDELLMQSTAYLRIVCFGLIFTFLYNLFASALRAVGDSRTPLVALAISTVLNIAADLLFVAVLRWGVVGAAAATVLSQVMSAIFCMGYVWARVPILHPSRSQMRPQAALLRRTLGYSWITALQQAAIYVGKVLVQSTVNTLGVDTIAAFNAVNRVDDFAYTPQQNIAHAMTTFIAQNRGAGRHDRIGKGFRAGFVLEGGYWCLLAVTVLATAPWLISFFVADSPAVVEMGTVYLRTMAFFYTMPALTNWIQGYFRGMGDLRITLISTTLQMVARVAFTVYLAPRYGIQGVAFACLGGWLCMLAYEVPVLLHAMQTYRMAPR